MWPDVHWPDSRCVMISLSPFDVQGETKPSPWIEDWRCVYDLKTGTFSVPADFPEHNLKALKTGSPDDRITRPAEPQRAGIRGTNEYVAARNNRFDGLGTAMP